MAISAARKGSIGHHFTDPPACLFLRQTEPTIFDEGLAKTNYVGDALTGKPAEEIGAPHHPRQMLLRGCALRFHPGFVRAFGLIWLDTFRDRLVEIASGKPPTSIWNAKTPADCWQCREAQPRYPRALDWDATRLPEEYPKPGGHVRHCRDTGFCIRIDDFNVSSLDKPEFTKALAKSIATRPVMSFRPQR